MLVAEKFIKSLVDKYDRHIVYRDGNLVSISLQSTEIETPYTFIIRE